MHTNLRQLPSTIFNCLFFIGAFNNIGLIATKRLYLRPFYVMLITFLFLTITTSTSFSQKIKVTGKVFLEGPFDETTSQMVARLKLDSLVSNGKIPEAPTALPVPTKLTHTYNAIDAIRLFLTRPDFTRADSIYAWVAEDGNFYDIYSGTSKTLTFNNAPEGTYFLEIRHRNHLSMMYASAIAFRFNTTPAFDFTKLSNIYQGGAIMVTPTVCAMIAGNALSDRRGEVNARDLYAVSKDSDNLKEGYLSTDVDLNGVVNALDRQLTLEHNLKLYHSKVPQ